MSDEQENNKRRKFANHCAAAAAASSRAEPSHLRRPAIKIELGQLDEIIFVLLAPIQSLRARSGPSSATLWGARRQAANKWLLNSAERAG